MDIIKIMSSMNMKAIPCSLFGWTIIAGTHCPFSITSFEKMHIIWFLLSSHGFKQCPCKIAEHIHHFYKHDIYLNKSSLLWKESLNSDGHQFHQYQQNEESPLIPTELTEHKKRHYIWRWKSMSWLEITIKMWRD